MGGGQRGGVAERSARGGGAARTVRAERAAGAGVAAQHELEQLQRGDRRGLLPRVQRVAQRRNLAMESESLPFFGAAWGEQLRPQQASEQLSRRFRVRRSG